MSLIEVSTFLVPLARDFGDQSHVFSGPQGYSDLSQCAKEGGSAQDCLLRSVGFPGTLFRPVSSGPESLLLTQWPSELNVLSWFLC